MSVLVAILFLSAAQLAQEKVATPSGKATSPKITNSDILLMHRSGLSDEVISEKVRISTCNFDTSPTALADLKASGVSDSVVLEIIHCESRGPLKQETPSAETSKLSDSSAPKAYSVSFLKSDRKWRYGFRSEPYDKISDYLETKLVETLQPHGLTRLSALDGDCCFLTIELLEVTSHPAAIKKPGVDVTANLTVTDSSKRLLYSKGYRGESRTVMNTWGHLINHAVEEMVKSMASDENLTRTLATGNPNGSN